MTVIVKKLHPEYDIDFRSAGWQALLSGLEIRNRITHPKNRQDMDVTSPEIDVIGRGVFWFLEAVISHGRAGITAYLERSRLLFSVTDRATIYGHGNVWPSVRSGNAS